MKQFALILALVPLLLVTNQAHAQTEEDFFSVGIFPPVIEINADPPAKVEANMAIENLNENPQILQIIYKTFRLSSTRNGEIEYITEDNLISGPDPLILQKVKIYDGDEAVTEVELGPFEAKELKLEVDLEKNAPLGDYYFSVIFVSKTDDLGERSLSQSPGGIGTNVILSVGKVGEVRGELLDFSAPKLLGGGPVPFTLLLKNTSNHYITPTGRISIKNMFGKDVGRVDILPQYILANSERYMIDTDQASTSAKVVNPAKNTLIWTDKFLFGMYTATAHVKLSNEGPVFEKNITFWAIPLYLVFAVSFVSFVLLGIYLRVKKQI